jgi:hypothetical protein
VAPITSSLTGWMGRFVSCSFSAGRPRARADCRVHSFNRSWMHAKKELQMQWQCD